MDIKGLGHIEMNFIGTKKNILLTQKTKLLFMN